MKTIRFVISALLVSLWAISTSAVEKYPMTTLADARAAGGPVTASASVPAHPRILWLKGEEKILKQQLKKHPAWMKIHNQVIGEAVRILDLPPAERVMQGRRLLHTSREVERRIFFLSYAWRMTGESRFAARAEAEMLKASGFFSWNPDHYLDVGEMALGLAVGYDWCYDQLSPASRETIAEALLTKGLHPSVDPPGDRPSHYNWWLTTENNWNQVCHGGLLYASLALWDTHREEVLPYINRSIALIPRAMGEYAPGGAYPEGAGYWGYGTTFNVLFIDALQKAFGSDFGLSEAPGFMRTGLFSQQMITPALNQFNYYDNNHSPTILPVVFWFYNKTRDPALLYMQKQMFDSRPQEEYLDDRTFPMALLWGAACGAPLDNPAVPQDCFYFADGRTPIVSMRSAWDDPGALYVGFKAGSPGTNHGHMDVGEFILEADGVRWAMDLGSENYLRLETAGMNIWERDQLSQRWDVFRYRNQTHNVPTFNDRLQWVDSMAYMEDYGQREGLMFAASNLTPLYTPYVDRIVRAVSLVEGSYAVVQDRITTGAHFAKVRWNMVTEAQRIDMLSDNVAILRNGAKVMYLRVEAPFPVRLQRWSTTPPNSYDSPNPGSQMVGFECDLPLQQTFDINVYLMPRRDYPSATPPYDFGKF